MLNLKHKKFFVCAMMTVLLLSLAAASVANARDVDTSTPPASDEGEQTSDTPNLIMTLDGNANDSDSQIDEANLYQTQDSPAEADDNSTRVVDQSDAESGGEENNLIAAQASPDFSALVAGCLSLIVAAAAVGVLMFVRRRKAD